MDVNNSLIDKLEVEQGYENALDALLGDELYYSTDDTNLIHWKLLDEIPDELSLPEKCQPLSNFVKGSKFIIRRLKQTGLVKKDDGNKLVSDLKYGQRLVSKEGDLWRWDGLIVLSSSGSPALDRLQQRNKLVEILKSINEFEIEFGSIEKLREKSDLLQESITNSKIDLDRINTEINNKEDIEKKIPNSIELISSLEKRIENFKNEKDNYMNLPEEIDKNKNTLNTLIERASIKKFDSEDKLINLENKINEIRLHQREATEKEAQLRESEGRLEILLQNNTEKKKEIDSQIVRDLKLDNDQLLKLVNFNDDNLRPDELTAEQNFERFKNERELLGGVNLRADDELKEVQDRFDQTKSERDDLDAAISKLKIGISELNQESRERMKLAFDEVNDKFQSVFKKLFGGGNAELNFVDSDDPLEAGLEMLAQPPGKKLKSMESLSGGEKALTAISLIFAVFLTNPSPICVLDEVDAPLDDANVERFCDLIEEMSKNVNTRFLIITHHALTMSRMDRLFGVTMQEKGISKLVSVDLKTAEKFRKLA